MKSSFTYEQLSAAYEQGQYHVVVDHADDVLLAGRCLPDQIGQLFFLKCQAALGLGQPAVAIPAGEQALSWAQKSGDWDLEGLTRISLGCGLVLIGRVADGATLFEGFFANRHLYKNALVHEALARYNLGVAYRHTGRLAEAVGQYRMALQMYQSAGEEPMTASVRQNLAWALMLQQDSEGAREQLDAVRDYVARTLDLKRLQSLMVDLAAYHFLKGEVAEAKHICRDLVQALDERERSAHLATTYLTLGRIGVAEGRLEEACRFAHEARGHAEKAERWDLHNEASRLLRTLERRKEGD